jgi:hypothetical protein
MDCLGLYVDVENLQDIAKEAISGTFDRWPEEVRRPSLLRLYVRADNVGIWRMWAVDGYPSLDVEVIGVQHYAASGSKNSADIALALDAIADLLKGRTSYLAILSDDSDFATLFGKIAQEIPRADGGRLPFIWFKTDRPDTRSSILDEFLPAHYVTTVICAKQKTVTINAKPATQQKTATAKAKPPAPQKIATAETKHPPQTTDDQGLNVSFAETIIRHVPVGSFRHADCMKVVKEYLPEHPFAKLSSVNFGDHFVKTMGPILERYGVRVSIPNRRPRRYEMTAQAKQNFGVS